MVRVSSVLKSPHKDLVDSLLNSGKMVSEVYRILKDKGITSLSLSALYRYKNSHFVTRRIPNIRLYKILIETGNYNLVKSLERTVKIYETRKMCKCVNILPSHIYRRGRIYVCLRCNGWIPYDSGMYIIYKHKKGVKESNNLHYVSATAKSYC